MPTWYIAFVVLLGLVSLFAGVGPAIINPIIAIALWFAWLFLRNLVRGISGK